MPLTDLTYEDLQVLMKRLLRRLGQPTRLAAQQLSSEVVAWRINYILVNRTRLQRTMA